MIREWWNAPAKWWQFWLPNSGLIGGLTTAAIVYGLGQLI